MIYTMAPFLMAIEAIISQRGRERQRPVLYYERLCTTVLITEKSIRSEGLEVPVMSRGFDG